MPATRRPYAASSVEDLEKLFEAQREDSAALSRLAQELSFRKSQRARQLLGLVTRQLASTAPVPDSLSTEAPAQDALVDDEEWAIGEYGESGDAHNAFANSSVEAPGNEEPPDDLRRPRHFSRIRPLGTPGLPPAWVPTLKTDRALRIASDADLPQLYVAALVELVSEIKATGKGQKRYELENGVRVEGQEPLYEFVFTDDTDLFEDAKVEVQISGTRIDGSIVSINSGRLWLALSEDLGSAVKRAVLLVDNTALLEALKQRIEDTVSGGIIINRAIADAVVGRQQPPLEPAPIPEVPSNTDLDSDKRKALRKALTAAVTYVWGPPGCGKTHLLGEIVRSAFEAGKRVIVCSNTNKAVDQVLYRTCENLGKDHRAMDEGRIVRLGRIADDKLANEYNDYVSVDGILERRSADLKARQAQLQKKIADIDVQSAKAREVIKLFGDLDAAQSLLDAQLEATNKIARQGKELNTTAQAIIARQQELHQELEKRRKALLSFLQRSEKAIQADISETDSRLRKLRTEIETTKTQYTEAKARFELAKSRRDRLHTTLASVDRSLANRIIATAEKARAPLISELREIEIKISDLQNSIIKDAKVLGATCTKAYLSVKEINQVDMVIIDEASMVPLPMAWFVAGLARERVVVSGDFRQIPPIIQTSQQCIYDVLGKDVFAVAGLDGRSDGDSRIEMLETQYRMNKDICELISEPMYDGKLKTSPNIGQNAFLKTPTPLRCNTYDH